MANPFDRMAARMDSVTQSRLGKPVMLNGAPHVVVEAHFLPELQAVSGDGISLVVFTEGYRPRRNDPVEFDGKTYIVTRYQLFNGKPHIWIE
ncbi:MAG: ATP-binding protein [Serratia liquefaciens]|uniref:ATP-binding protein n=1 Tax=Serratia TaxID=613 RepID=UPI0021B756AF|nr:MULTISPECIES: ATP-binding protein [Serratia]MCH4196665.1 ATP-binding protein [Serratia liquefaciens]MCH4233409.1 ATP-binding protein [Serratia liquefaciens]MCH4261600.1 ATP-binding protein [Serratia liquefaciens]MCI1214133.1 ATP-binding protein [Serratia liquefaciens]MCI1235486.1 ATP-binding protein [Serratia liquefaciens]